MERTKGTTVGVEFEHPDKAEAAKLARWLRRNGDRAESHHFRVTVNSCAAVDRIGPARAAPPCCTAHSTSQGWAPAPDQGISAHEITESPGSGLHLSGLLPPLSVSKPSPSAASNWSLEDPPQSVSMSSGCALLGSASLRSSRPGPPDRQSDARPPLR